MSEDRFQVIVQGLAQGADPEHVKEQLADRFKGRDQSWEALLSGDPVTVKETTDLDEAEKLAATLRETGLVVRVTALDDAIMMEESAAGSAVDEPRGGQKPRMWINGAGGNVGAAESLRVIKNKINAFCQEETERTRANVILFTGSGPKVGTSSITANLALLFAEDFLDRRILAVDTDFKKPSIHHYFSVRGRPGIMEYLLENKTLDVVTRKTQIANLDVIPAGAMNNPVSSPFDLKRFDTFIEQVSVDYDFVLMDAAPALQSSHSRIICPKVGAVVVIAEANVTRWEVLRELQEQMAADKAELLGGILNKRRFVIPKWVYRFI